MNCFLSERDKDLDFILYALYSTSLQYSHYLRKKQRNVICADDLKRCHMDKRKQDIAYFISFCIEQYKNEKGISGAKAMALLAEYGVLEYLAEHWEVLHTQSRQWILEDIDEFIRARKGEGV